MFRFSLTLFFFIIIPIFLIIQSRTNAFDENIRIRLKYKAHIMNGLATDKVPTRIHCYSKDDDLGAHLLWMKEEFRFEFTVDFWKKTHFWCDMGFGTNERTVDVFQTGIETHTCRSTGNCFWSMREDGIYFSNNDQSWVKKYDW